MKLTDLHEYGSSGPYSKGGTMPTGGMTASAPGNNAAKKIPILAPKVAPIKTVKDIPPPSKENPKEPVGVYDKNKKLVAIAARQTANKPPVLIDPKTKKPMQNLRGLFIQDPASQTGTEKMESVLDKFLQLSLAEQLRIVEHLDVNKLDRILNEDH